MSFWMDISTAPKDGTVVKVKRQYGREVVYVGQAVWRTVNLEALPPHPISGAVYAPSETATGWMYPDVNKRVPTPTHWKAA